MSAHFFRRAGSVCGKLAFCPNLVFGRLTVFFRSRVCVPVAIISKCQKRNSNRFGVRRQSGATTALWICALSLPLWERVRVRAYDCQATPYFLVSLTPKPSPRPKGERKNSKQKARTAFSSRDGSGRYSLRCFPAFSR